MKALTCIVCPRGCQLINENNVITGYSCLRGLEYAKQEYTSPIRVLTSTICLNNSNEKRLPVYSSKALPKDMLLSAMEIIKNTKVSAPIKINQVIIANILGLNIDILASKSISS